MRSLGTVAAIGNTAKSAPSAKNRAGGSRFMTGASEIAARTMKARPTAAATGIARSARKSAIEAGSPPSLAPRLIGIPSAADRRKSPGAPIGSVYMALCAAPDPSAR